MLHKYLTNVQKHCCRIENIVFELLVDYGWIKYLLKVGGVLGMLFRWLFNVVWIRINSSVGKRLDDKKDDLEELLEEIAYTRWHTNRVCVGGN